MKLQNFTAAKCKGFTVLYYYFVFIYLFCLVFLSCMNCAANIMLMTVARYPE